MMHDPKRIQLIERWARWLAWVSLLSGILAIIMSVVIQIANQIGTPNVYQAAYESFWYQTNMIINYLTPIAITLKNFLLFLGVSLVIRFLQNYHTKISSAD